MVSLPRSLVFSLLVATLFTGCAGKPLSTVDRAKYSRAAIAPSIKKPETYSYFDTGMQTTEVVSSQFGFVGPFIGAAVMAAQEKAGKKRVAGVIESSGIEPGGVTKEAFERELQQRWLFDLRSPNPDATFHLEIVRWGFGPGGGGLLSASLAAKVELRDRQGAKVWGRSAYGLSTIHGTKEQFHSDAKLYAEAFREVAGIVASKLIGEAK